MHSGGLELTKLTYRMNHRKIKMKSPYVDSTVSLRMHGVVSPCIHRLSLQTVGVVEKEIPAVTFPRQTT